MSEKVAALLGNITFWHDNRGVCRGTEVSACGKVGCLQTKIALSQFSLCVPLSSMRGKNKEIGGVTERESWIQKFDGEWRRGSPDSFVCSLMWTLPGEN